MIVDDDPWVIRQRRIRALTDRLRTLGPERLSRLQDDGRCLADHVHEACVRVSVGESAVPRLANSGCADQWQVIARESYERARRDGDDRAAGELDAVMEHLRSIT